LTAIDFLFLVFFFLVLFVFVMFFFTKKERMNAAWTGGTRKFGFFGENYCGREEDNYFFKVFGGSGSNSSDSDSDSDSDSGSSFGWSEDDMVKVVVDAAGRRAHDAWTPCLVHARNVVHGFIGCEEGYPCHCGVCGDLLTADISRGQFWQLSCKHIFHRICLETMRTEEGLLVCVVCCSVFADMGCPLEHPGRHGVICGTMLAKRPVPAVDAAKTNRAAPLLTVRLEK
jgi:hypothetical protein